MYGSNLTNVSLQNQKIERIDLQSINLTGSNLAGTEFINTKLNGAKFIGTDLTGSTFILGELCLTDFTAANLSKTKFIDANLKKTKFKSALSSFKNFTTFEEQINYCVGQTTDLSGISGGFDEENLPYIGEPIFGVLTQEEADKIIAEYKESVGDVDNKKL